MPLIAAHSAGALGPSAPHHRGSQVGQGWERWEGSAWRPPAPGGQAQKLGQRGKGFWEKEPGDGPRETAPSPVPLTPRPARTEALLPRSTCARCTASFRPRRDLGLALTSLPRRLSREACF